MVEHQLAGFLSFVYPVSCLLIDKVENPNRSKQYLRLGVVANVRSKQEDC